MAKNQKNEGGGVCKKISKAVSFTSLTAKNHRDRDPNPNPRRVNDPPSGRKEILGVNEPHDHQKAARKGKKPFVRFGGTKTAKFDTSGERSEDPNENFSNYIKKIKNKMVKPHASKSKSNVATTTTTTTGKRPLSSAPRRDSFNERVSDYINRVKMKIRATSSIGSSKPTSFK